MMDVAYGFTKTLAGVPFESARARIEETLKAEGFGVLTEIDVQGTLKEKLGVPFRRYRILGVCNPGIAHRVLSIDPGVGLLLPCTVVVTEDEQANAVVSVLDPAAMAALAGDAPALEAPMKEARERLQRALAAA